MSRSRPPSTSAPSSPGWRSCAGCGRDRPTSRWTPSGFRARSRSSRPRARRAPTRSRSWSRFGGCSCPPPGSSSRPRPSSGRTRSRCRSRRERRRAPAPRAGSPPTWPRPESAPPRSPRTASSPKPDAGAQAVAAFRQLITTLRLFKAGGVSLGPYAWTRAGTNRWRRIATGAGRSRPGGYRLSEQELGDLTALSRTLAYRSSPFALGRGRRPRRLTGARRARSRASRRGSSESSRSRR